MKRLWKWLMISMLCIGAMYAYADTRGFFRIQSSGDTRITEFSSDGTIVWSNAVVGSTGRIQWALALPAEEEDWEDAHSFSATEAVMAGILPLVDYMVIDLSGGPSAASYPVSYLSAVPTGGWTDEYKTTKLVMRRIPAGTFTMGSPPGEMGRYADREAQRQVTLTRAFYIGVFQVTQRQWELVLGNRPSGRPGDARPVERVSYNDIRGASAGSGWPASSAVDATAFMGRLRAKTGLATLDLPTEAQWEYACRAGTTTALNSGKNLTSAEFSCPNMAEVGRYRENQSDGKGGYSTGTTTVGSYLANQWGLYDMHGNVWEWCLDWYTASPPGSVDPAGAASGAGRVLRGGGLHAYAKFCRSAYRGSTFPSSRGDSWDYGFRLSRTLP